VFPRKTTSPPKKKSCHPQKPKKGKLTVGGVETKMGKGTNPSPPHWGGAKVTPGGRESLGFLFWGGKKFRKRG